MALQVISSAITIDIPEQRCKQPAGWGRSDSWLRESLLHGAYPDKVHPELLKQTQKTLQTSEHKLRELTAAEVSQVLPPWYIHHMVTMAELFTKAVWWYLYQQAEITDADVADLFAAFAAVAGLHFTSAQSVTKQRMKVLGVDVESDADLRAYAAGLTLPDTNNNMKKPGLKTVAIAQVKAAPPNPIEVWQDTLHPLLGQILGEMVLEMPHTALPHAVVAFAVQSTKVRVCLLTLSKQALEYIQDPNHNPEQFKHLEDPPFERGVLDWSVSFNIVKPKDRLRLWLFMMALVNSDQI